MPTQVSQNKLPTEQHSKRQPPTPEQIRAQQKRDAEKNRAGVQANLPAAAKATAVAAPDTRTGVQKYLDEIAPASIVGRPVKFSKEGKFITADDDAEIGDDVDHVALCDQTLVGFMRFHKDGSPPDRMMGLLYEGFTMPPRANLGDLDPTNGKPGLTGNRPTPGSTLTTWCCSAPILVSFLLSRRRRKPVGAQLGTCFTIIIGCRRLIPTCSPSFV